MKDIRFFLFVLGFGYKSRMVLDFIIYNSMNFPGILSVLISNFPRMMSRGRRALGALGRLFKWKRRRESSSSRAGPPEIELSHDYHYHRVPSPSAFVGDDDDDDGDRRFEAEPIADLDLFLERLYNYYCEKGFWCIIIKWFFELSSLVFAICFSGFFLLCVNWNGLLNAKCGRQALRHGLKACDLSKEALHRHPLTPFTLTKAVILGYLGIFCVYWIFCFLRFFVQLKDTLKIRRFFYQTLQVRDNELQSLTWDLILDKVVQAQKLSVHEVVMRLMRKENYLIGMINKGVLAFSVPSWIPGAGPKIKFGPKSNGVQYRLMFTNILEWTLSFCVLQRMFDGDSRIRKEFVSDPETLKKRLRILGGLMILLSPFLVVFMLVSLFLKHAEQLCNHPSRISSRRWSNLSKWLFREFNEVSHFFNHRINNVGCLFHASEYLKQFPSPKMSTFAKFISFISGGFAASLIIIALFDESLLEGQLYGRNLLWYAAVFSSLTAISRAMVPEETFVLDPEGKMSLVVQHSHYMPKKWRGRANSNVVRKEFERLFPYTGILLLEEICSVFVTPFLLIFSVPNRIDDILQFVADFTMDLEGVGHVCSFSVFDFENHGNFKYGSPFNSPGLLRSSQGKMEKSFFTFQGSYPSWEPNSQGKLFLKNIETFMDRNHPTYFACNYHRNNQPNLLHFDRPYILDLYYSTSQIPRNSTTDSKEEPSLTKGVAAPAPSFWRQNEVQYSDKFWDQLFDDRASRPNDDDRRHLEGGSAFDPLLGESVLNHQESNGVRNAAATGQWWARQKPPESNNPEGSFLEPRSFSYHGGDLF